MKRFLILAALLVAQPAFANHPGERIDEVMTDREPAFEVADSPSTPELSLEEPDGDVLRLGDLAKSGHGQVVKLVVRMRHKSPRDACLSRRLLTDADGLTVWSKSA
mgnify:CR=1 FL=1